MSDKERLDIRTSHKEKRMKHFNGILKKVKGRIKDGCNIKELEKLNLCDPDRAYEGEKDYADKIITGFLGVLEKYGYGLDCRILEVGPRCGRFAELLKENLYEHYHGLELVDEFVKYCVEKGFAVIKGDICNLKIIPQPFDILYSRHVLEHVIDPAQAIANMDKCLTSGGLMFIHFPIGELSVKHLNKIDTPNHFKELVKWLGYEDVYFGETSKYKEFPIKSQGYEYLYIGIKP